MTKLILLSATICIAGASIAQPIPSTNALASKGSISVQEMLVIGHSGLKLHSLAMITQGNIEGEIDETYLPGFKVCSEDSAPPVRSVTARLLGQYFVQGKDEPNPEAIDLLLKLAQDESSDVRYSAIYHGLSQIKNKSPKTVEELVNLAINNRDEGLFERITESLKNNRQEVIAIMDTKLATGTNVAVFEVYEELTGKTPPNAEKYMQMPSSRPRMYIFKATETDSSVAEKDLKKALKGAGLKEPTVTISGTDENFVLLVKTYLVKDYKAVESAFADNAEFSITQNFWLTPQMETQLESINSPLGPGKR